MNKYDDILNELVYQIDDIVYSFYSDSNQIIATKRSQERLLTFRDSTLNTINDMNVRSLEIISGFKSRDLIEERAEKLLVQNMGITASALDVLQAAPNRSEFLEDVNEMASNLFESAKDVYHKVEASGAVEKIVDVAQEGYHKAVAGFEELSKKPAVVEGTQVIKEKTKEAVDIGSKVVRESSRKFADWISDLDASYEEDSKEEPTQEGEE